MNHLKISKRVRVFLFFSKGFKRFSGLPKPFSQIVWTFVSLWQAVWLGLLDSEYLNEITWTYYMGKSGFEEEEFNIYQGLWPWEFDAVQNNFKACKRVLVAGAGGGREVIALVRLGYEVTAFDFSPYLTAACRKNLEKADCSAVVLDAPADGLPNGLGVYDSLFIGRGFYHHIPGRRRRVTFLKACRASLKVDAPIFLSDFFTRPVSSRFYQHTQGVANILRRLRHHRERVELGDWLTNCMQHAFTRPEVEQELFDAGIKLEIYAETPFSEESHLAHAIGSVI